MVIGIYPIIRGIFTPKEKAEEKPAEKAEEKPKEEANPESPKENPVK